MEKKVISLQQLEEAMRDMSRWIRDKLAGYIKEPEAEGQSGNVLMTNGAGGRSWGEVRSDDLWRPTVSEDGVLSWERSVNPNEPAAANIAGPAGVDGGYYTLRLTQPEANTLQFDFAPSKPDMPVVEPVQVNLPAPESGGNVDLTGYATEQYVREYAQPVGDYALKNEIPTVPVKSVNGKTGAVSLTASDVGALPSTYTPPNQTAEQVGADPKGTAATAVSRHNTADDAHGDIRLELKAINDRLTAFFDSDDQTLDELSEIVAIITSNKALIDSITTSKVSVADIINNLTTNVTNKPLSAAQGVALKGLIDAVRNSLAGYQLKGDYALRSEIPTVPTKVSAFENDKGYLTEHQDISGKLDANALPTAINAALAQAKASGEFDGADGKDGKDGADGRDGIDATPVTPLFVNSIEECTDTTKPYVLPDGYIYAYMLTEIEPEPLFTNMIDSATIHEGQRYSLSGGSFKDSGGTGDAVVFKIPSSGSITIRLRNCSRNQSYPQIYGGTSATAFTKSFVTDSAGWNTDSNGDQYVTFTNSSGCTYVVAMLATVDKSTAIITVNEEIKWSEGGTGYKWENTGHAFVPADYESRILDIEEDVSAQAKQISNLEKKVENIGADESIEAAYDRIKNWNYPIYEDAPVFLLESNKPAMGTSEPKTTAGIYAKYDVLMAANSHYITRENCGMASDGATPIYAYHFKEPDPRSPYQGMWREKKPVILACSGVHQEWAGVYSLYYAMEEITTNTKLLDLRRNVHFVIFPMLNPTAATDSEYKMRNPDGIQVHHNFEVGHGENGAVQGDRYYGGATPLSIPETQYFDAVMNRYKDDLACVLSCHNNVVDEKYGTSFIWCSCATYFMTNLGNRLAEKMSSAWLEKHGDVLVEGIRWANNYALEQAATGTHPFFKDGFTATQPDWDLRIGWAGLSGSGGTEYRHGMKYGVHGINVEVCPRCVLDKNYNAEYTSNVMTMGAETYINYFRTYMAAYDPKDKKDYAPNLPWGE